MPSLPVRLPSLRDVPREDEAPGAVLAPRSGAQRPWAFPCWSVCPKVTLMRPSPVTVASAEPVPVVRYYILDIFLGAGGWKAEEVWLRLRPPYSQAQRPHLPQVPWSDPELSVLSLCTSASEGPRCAGHWMDSRDQGRPVCLIVPFPLPPNPSPSQAPHFLIWLLHPSSCLNQRRGAPPDSISLTHQ